MIRMIYLFIMFCDIFTQVKVKATNLGGDAGDGGALFMHWQPLIWPPFKFPINLIIICNLTPWLAKYFDVLIAGHWSGVFSESHL